MRFNKFITIVLLVITCAWHTANAAPSNYELALKGLTQQYTLDQQQHQGYLERFAKLQQAQLPTDVSKSDVDRVQLMLASSQADLANAKEMQTDLQQQYDELKENLNERYDELQEARVQAVDYHKKIVDLGLLQIQLNVMTSLTDLQAERLGLWKRNVALLEKLVKQVTERVNAITHLYYQKQNQQRQQQLIDLAAKVQSIREKLLVKIADLNRQMEQYTPDEQYSNPNALQLGFEQYQTNEAIFLAELELRLQSMNDAVQDLMGVTGKKLPIAQLDSQLQQADLIHTDLQNIQARINAKQNLLQNKSDILQQSFQQHIITNAVYLDRKSVLDKLRQHYAANQATLAQLDQNVANSQAKIQRELTHFLAERQVFPGFDQEAWHSLLQKTKHIPVAALHLLVALKDHIILASLMLPSSYYYLIATIEACIILLASIAYRYACLASSLIPESRKHVSSNMAYALLELFKRNWIALLMVTLILVFFTLANVPAKSYRFFLYLTGVWFVFRTLAGITRMWLLEGLSNISGKDVALYNRLIWILRIGAVIAATMLLMREMVIAYDVRDLIHRISMLFLLSLSIVLFCWRSVLPELVESYLDGRHRYLRLAVDWFAWLFPISLFLNALIGLIGYLQLAWVMSFYQALIVIMVSLFIILRGFIVDFMDWLADQVVVHMQNGWLWREALLKPLDKVVRVAILLVTAGLVVYLFLENLQISFAEQWLNFMDTELLHFPQNAGSITWRSFLQFSVMAIVLVWLARWMREIAYRVFYRNLRDQSLRNSLAIFTQYAVVTVWLMLTLRALGVDLSGLSYIMGGLAVGFGLGLRDFANNIVSGMMLLIERPVRVGDVVSVGEHEGTVIQIGLRSMTLRSWDYLEVLIPNAELFNKTFTNWTRQDSIVRTVIKIKIHRDDDPNRVQKIVSDVLTSVPAVLSEPAPQIFLQEITDSLLEMEIRYFVNLEHHIRVAIRSDVLMLIWERFEAAGVRRPYPQQDIRLLNQNA